MNREAAQEQILRDFFRLLRRQWVVIALTTIVAVAVAVAYSVLKTPEYQATAQLQFIDKSQYLPEIGIGNAFSSLDQATLAAQGAERVTSPEVVDAVSKRAQTDKSKSELKDSITTSVNPDNNLVAVSARADDAQLATTLANTFAEQTQRVLTQSERQRLLGIARGLEHSVRHQEDGSITKLNAEQTAAQLRSVSHLAQPVEIASPAEKPGSPISPKPVRDVLLALVLGLIFGTLLALLRDSLDRRLKDPHDVQHQLQIPLLGYVEADTLGGIGFAANGSERESDHSLEPFRILRSNVEFLASDRPPRAIAVTSALAQEGKSTVAAGLATAATLAGKRVMLVECDLRRPVFADRFNVSATPGLTDWASGNAEPGDVIQQISVDRRNGRREEGHDESASPSLTVISAGSFSTVPAELLGSGRFTAFVEQVKEVYDLVVFDCAPLLPVGDALEVLRHADAALLCVRLDRTTREQALAAKAAIEHLPQRPVGLVITGVRPGREGYYYGYYSSGAQAQPAIVVQPPPSG